MNDVLNIENWKIFEYKDIFEIKKGYYNKKPPHTLEGDIPFIGATQFNNGVTEYYNIEDIKNYEKSGTQKYDNLENKLFDGNCIVVINNGSVGYAFYQNKKFTCSHDVNPLYLKHHTLNKIHCNVFKNYN